MSTRVQEFQHDDRISGNPGSRTASTYSASDAWHRKTHALWEQGHRRLAFRRFLAAARAGDFTAQLNLGYFYDLGIGVKRKKSAALRWYEQAYIQGVAAGATCAGTIYRDWGDFETALMWMERGVSLGDADANWEIAKMCFRQRGDISKTMKYLKQALRAKPGQNITKWSYEAAERFLRRIEGRVITA